MPPTPSTPGRSSYNRRSAPVTPKSNTPKPTGLYDSNSVQDRINQWQSQGAATAPAPDAISILSNPASDIERPSSRESRSQLSNNKDNLEPMESTTKRRGGRTGDRDSMIGVREIRSSSTPRKRVISDTNWKVNIKAKEPRSSNATPRQESRTRELGNESDHTSAAGIEREERRRRMREAKRSRRRDDERLKEIYGTSTPPVVDPEPPYEDPDMQSNIDDDLARRFTRPTQDSVPPQIVSPQNSIRPDEDDGRHRRRSKYAESLGAGPDSSESRTGLKQRRGSIFNKTREIFSKTEPIPTRSNRLPSIEAWLEEQPDDPFVEDGEAPVEIPPPLKPRTRRRVSAETKPQAVEDPNKIWDHVPREITPPSQRRKRRSRDPEQVASQLSEDIPFTGCVPVQDVLQQSPDQSPGGLKRRGARLSRLRDRSLGIKEKTPEPLPATPPKAQSPLTSVSEVVDSYSYHQTKHMPEEFSDKPCPPTHNRRLSTIASVETFSSNTEKVQQKEQNAEVETWDFLKLDGNGLKRRLTTHEDLMSQLSLPVAGKPLRKTRSKNCVQPTTSTSTVQEVFDSIKADEEKYSRELRTLVDGVIPVLLQCVLSKSDSIAAAGLFTSSTNSKDVTRPIVDMGIALERLKSFHNRIPTDKVEALLAWAQSAHKAYSDYLKAWRLGFQDVVVNLATKDDDSSEIDKGMPRDQNGDVVTADGKKVDVAYLLKRPLVRVKKLSKSMAEIKAIVNTISAARVANMYEDLTELARKRTQEEQGRLEDEAAGNIDATKARDLRTMTVSTGISIDKTRIVKAKDCFSMTLYHTSGQRVDCRIEIILRDNREGPSSGGDILFSEIDDTGRWLLFPPIDRNTVSARKGDKPDDLVVMVRGTGRQAWHEMLELKADDVETANEWMDMLGSNPLPPKLVRSLSFLAREEAEKYSSEAVAKPLSAETLKQINGSEIEIPIGEPSVVGNLETQQRQVSPQRQVVEKPLPKLNLGGGLQKSSQQPWTSPTSSRVPLRKPVGSSSVGSSDRSTYSAPSTLYSGSSHTPTMSSSSADPDLHRNKVSREDMGSTSRTDTKPETPRKLSRTDEMSREWMTSPKLSEAEMAKAHGNKSPEYRRSKDPSPERPGYQRAKSSTPSKDLPTIPRVRGVSGQPASTTITSSIADQWASLSTGRKDQTALPSRSRKEQSPSRTIPVTEDLPATPKHKVRPTSMPAAAINTREPQKESRALQPLSDNVLAPKMSRKSMKQSDKKARPLSSSPLKHEYAPSVASSDESDTSISDASDLFSEDEDTPTPLVPVAEMRRQSRGPPPSAFRQNSSSKTATLAPSDSASQGPYRSVPSVPASEKRQAIALVCTWSDRGQWVPINSGETCSVVISPGLVEVFEKGSTQSQSQSNNSSPANSRENSLTLQPLIGFELTINVMMHGGTGLDITLRSPPTPNSRIKNAGSTVLFRSSTMAEKQLLYHLLNHSRMNNPTMLALMAARAKKEREHPPAVNFALGEPARHSRTGSFGGIFGLGRSSKGSSYRASSAPAPQSISGETTESSGSTSRNLLKRLSAGSAFALNRSSVLKKAPGTVASSSLSGSSTTPFNSQSGYIPPHGPNVPTTSNAAVEGAGMVNSMKVRLHVREKNRDKWLNMGAVRLSVLPANAAATNQQQRGASGGGEYSPSGSGSNTPTGGGANTPRMPSATYRTAFDPSRSSKRIVIIGADKDKDRDSKKNTAGQTFLDAVLPEAAFERIQRIGIAINVWKEEERIAQQGGVLLGRNTVWCVSFASERECAWVFGLVGRGVGMGVR